MRKPLYYLMGVSLLLALVPVVALSAAQTSVDLMTDQSIVAGEVDVWNAGGNLYVQFEAAEGWCIAETHLAVAGSLDEIPQTKNGNPKTGKFPNSAVYSPCEESPEAYVIPLEPEWGSEVYIAAHAVIGEVCSETVWQIGLEETNTCEGGLPTNYADEFNWGDPAGPCVMGPWLSVEQPAFTNPFVVGTTPVNEFPHNSNFNRGYATDFDVQWVGELLSGGELIVSWSPGQTATEKKLVSSDGFAPATFEAYGVPTAGGFLDTYPLAQHSVTMAPIPMGTHTIRFQHTQGDGTFWDWIRLEKPCTQWETGWGSGTAFDGANWAMYFTHVVP